MSVTTEGSLVILELNESLSLGETATEEYTPDSGKVVSVLEYVAELPISDEVVSCIAWGGAAVWNIRSSGKMPFKKLITNADGVKKVILQLDNINVPSPQAVSARVVLDVR